MPNEILKAGFQRFVQGARSAPREFFAPAVVIWRGVKFVFDQLDDAMRASDAGHKSERPIHTP